LPKNLTTEDIVFDKAKWHVNDDFPNDLDPQLAQVCSHAISVGYLCLASHTSLAIVGLQPTNCFLFCIAIQT